MARESRSHAGSAVAGLRGLMLERPHSTIERLGGRSRSTSARVKRRLCWCTGCRS